MSVVRKFHVPNRLATIMKQKGGIYAHEAISRAEAGVETMREECLQTIVDTMAEIDERFGPASDRDNAQFEELYVLGLRIIDVSGFVTETRLDRAVASLCTLVDNCSEKGRWRWPAVDVHLDAMKLLYANGEALGVEACEAVLDGLYQVSKHKPPEIEAAVEAPRAQAAPDVETQTPAPPQA